jgi:hypothetical protein
MRMAQISTEGKLNGAVDTARALFRYVEEAAAQGRPRMSPRQLKRGGRLLDRLSRGLSVLVKCLAENETVQCFQ